LYIKIFINFYSCKSNNERTKGCQEVSTSVDHIQTSSVDVDRELSRIHALCVTHIDRFDSVLSKYDIIIVIYIILFNIISGVGPTQKVNWHFFFEYQL